MSKADLSLFTLFPATREQVLISRRRTFAQWSGGTPLEKYLARDAFLEQFDHSANDNLIIWVLAPRDDPKTLDFACSCETYRRKVVVVSSEDGAPKLREAIGYGIASVYTPPAKRQHGYASHMLNLLHWVLADRNILSVDKFPAEWGNPPSPAHNTGDGILSVLYSDVGPVFYSQRGPSLDRSFTGWVAQGSIMTSFQLNTTKDIAPAEESDHEWKWMSVEDNATFFEHESERMKEDALQTSPEIGLLFTFLPKNGIALFNIQRTVCFSDDLSPSMPSQIWGVQRTDDSNSPFATWTYDIRVPPFALVVTRIRATKATFPNLYAKILEAARKKEVEKIEIWNLSKELEGVAAELGGITASREEHIPAVKWYGPESHDKVTWLFNEK
ncbi:hypothetical protein C8Q75DRAFT_712127 [Abortiporus biennis]|nr:hypothetical protein C8Q75DRAFT_712127 [Abortiporus biennis]